MGMTNTGTAAPTITDAQAASLRSLIENFLTEGLERFGSVEAFEASLTAYNNRDRG